MWEVRDFRAARPGDIDAEAATAEIAWLRGRADVVGNRRRSQRTYPATRPGTGSHRPETKHRGAGGATAGSGAEGARIPGRGGGDAGFRRNAAGSSGRKVCRWFMLGSVVPGKRRHRERNAWAVFRLTAGAPKE